MTMASLGLSTEFMVQLLTPRFMTFFLFVRNTYPFFIPTKKLINLIENSL